MNPNQLLNLATAFHSIAMAEKLPEVSKDLKTILKNIESLETYAARKKYAERALKHLSSGSSRIVYLTDDKTVIKLAKNDRGIAQNKAEVKADKSGSKYINKVLRSAKNDSWIEVPFLDDLTVKDFKEMTGIDFEDFGEALDYGIKEKSSSDGPKNFDKVKKTDIYKSIVDAAKKNDLVPGDLSRISSWKSKDGRPILVDAGLNYAVFDKYYEDNSSSSKSTSKSST